MLGSEIWTATQNATAFIVWYYWELGSRRDNDLELMPETTSCWCLFCIFLLRVSAVVPLRFSSDDSSQCVHFHRSGVRGELCAWHFCWHCCWRAASEPNWTLWLWFEAWEGSHLQEGAHREVFGLATWPSVPFVLKLRTSKSHLQYFFLELRDLKSGGPLHLSMQESSWDT